MDFTVQISSKCGQGGRGSKNPVMLWTSLMDAPSRLSIVTHPLRTGNDTTHELEVGLPKNLVPVIQISADNDSEPWKWGPDIEVIQISMKIWFLLWIQVTKSNQKP